MRFAGPQIHETGGGLNEAEVKRRHILPKALVVGIVAGLIASAFRLALEKIEHLRTIALTGINPWIALMIALIGGAAAGGLGLWLVRRFAPEAAGSGIPHLQSVLLGETEMRWKRLLPVKFFAAVLSIGGGLALGREGPTIQMGGAAGAMVARWFRIQTGFGEKKALISAGAGAGLAAAFNAPLAGVIFVLEELQGNFTPVVFVAAFLASVSADVVGRLLAGNLPVFNLRELPVFEMHELPYALVLGAIAGVGGVFFNRAILLSLDFSERLTCSKWFPGAVAGAAAGFVVWKMPELAGGGGLLADRAIGGGIVLGMLPVFLLVRLVLTLVSYGSGSAGGIFTPLLVIGALGGLLFGQGIDAIFPSALQHPEVFALLGMGALFTSMVRAPLTGIVLMVEMTGRYEFMLPLLASCLTSYGIAEAMGAPAIYEALRHRKAVV